jgi:hypothetical protein
MSMEIHVLFRGRLPGKAALTRTMKALGFPLAIVPAKGALEGQNGFMPMRLQREETGVEFDVFDGRTAVDELSSGLNVDPQLDRSANFRWGGDESEMLCALCAAAALAKLVDGVMLDAQEDRLLSAGEAIDAARDILKTNLKPDAKPMGTGPAHIKRYLKPLLQQRSDLVLIGRLLLVRPVRHLMRGVLFDRAHKGCFRLWTYLKPLYETQGFGDEIRYGYARRIHDLSVREPHFEPLLMETLADILDEIGPITTLADLAPMLSGTMWVDQARIRALFLAGERERAEDFARETEPRHRESCKGWLEAQQRFLSRDVAEVCAERRADEAKLADALKLGDVWEPSPFPVELPPEERASRSSEPAFHATPWIPRPTWLFGEMPERPGEVRFARATNDCRGRKVLEIELTPEQAKERHLLRETYVLAARLPDGLLSLVWHVRLGGASTPPPFAHLDMLYYVHLVGSAQTAIAQIEQRYDDFSVTHLNDFDVYDSRLVAPSIWSCRVELGAGERRNYDDRDDGKHVYTKAPLSPSERDLITTSVPTFGEYADVANRLRLFLRAAGFGEIE